MMPNHVFQLIALIAMEPPISFEAAAVRNEKIKILRAIQPLGPEEVLARTARGQYGAGEIDGKRVRGYRSEQPVSPQSSRETFATMKMLVDNWRWAAVPFYVRTGKRLHQQATEIVIQFRRVPFLLFRQTPVEHLSPNLLTIRIQPEEAVSLQFGAKIPGATVRVGSVAMNFRYSDYFGSSPRTGYETMFYDSMNGDATLFKCFDEVEASWNVITPILDVWGLFLRGNFRTMKRALGGLQLRRR